MTKTEWEALSATEQHNTPICQRPTWHAWPVGGTAEQQQWWETALTPATQGSRRGKAGREKNMKVLSEDTAAHLDRWLVWEYDNEDIRDERREMILAFVRHYPDVLTDLRRSWPEILALAEASDRHEM